MKTMTPILLSFVAAAAQPLATLAEAKKESPEAPHPAHVKQVRPEEIRGFADAPKQVRALIQSALALTHLELTYAFGSSSPGDGGMDCSGAINHVLKFQGLHEVPRQSDELCAWVRDHLELHLTPAARSLDDAAFAKLKPGDLVFWTGTYKTGRKLPVTHVMLYLGRHKVSGQRLLFGSSDGRSYEGERLCGVSVFDFKLPPDGSEARVYGFGAVPGLIPAEPEGEDDFDLLAEVPSPPVETQAVARKVAEPEEVETIKPAIVVEQTVAPKPKAVTTAKVPKKTSPPVASRQKPKARDPEVERPVRRKAAEPAPSTGRVAINEVGQALRSLGKSVREAIQP